MRFLFALRLPVLVAFGTQSGLYSTLATGRHTREFRAFWRLSVFFGGSPYRTAAVFLFAGAGICA